ncbi:hypothetical protein [Endozoicomonas sp. ALB091]|uniref:hypothetical protein n=1 Tax=Endozoicomonas sp. ALB091 TaxID=3403073 RepID=UPI003BB78C04
MCGGGGSSRVEKAGPYEQKLVELSRKRLDEYKKMYIPLENDRMAEARVAKSDSKVQSYTNDATAAARLNSAVPSAAPVGGGKLQAVMAQQQGNRVSGISASMGNQVAHDQYANRMLQMTGLGRQQSGQSVSTTGAAASREVGTAIARSRSDSMVSSAKYGMYGSIAGAGAAWAHEKHDLFGLNKEA